MTDLQTKTFLHGEQFRISPQALKTHPLVTQQMPHYYENSGNLMKRMNLSENTDGRSADEYFTSASSKTSNYVSMNPTQFYSNAYKDAAGSEDEVLSQKVLPLIPFDPTHNMSICGSSHPCHEYESIDPIRYTKHHIK